MECDTRSILSSMCKMKKNNFRKTGVAYYAPEMVRFIESITKDDDTGMKLKEVLRYVLSLVSDGDVTFNLMSDEEAKELRELTAKYNEL